MKRILLLLLLAGCKKSAPATDDAGWHPYKNVTPAKVKQQVEDINQRHEEQIDRAGQ